MIASQDPTAIRAEWWSMDDGAREALIVRALDKQDHDLLTALLNAFHEAGEEEPGRRLVLLDVVQRGDTALLAALTAAWYPALTAAAASDPTARLMADLVDMRHSARGARRALLNELIRDLDARWERPPELRNVVFYWPGYPNHTPNTEHD